MSPDSPFHEGERAVQERAGEAAAAERIGHAIGNAIPAGARPFLGHQRMIVLASRDAAGDLWASLLVGEAGLATTVDGRKVILDLNKAYPVAGDLFPDDLSVGADVGLLAIELSTRRRLRVNGTVIAKAGERTEIAVGESFANCPRYIQRRQLRVGRASGSADAMSRGRSLDEARAALVARADTAFVASGRAQRGLDASHRGGGHGFVRVVGERTLRMPDYPGNGMFATLGNLYVDPAAGLTLVDFDGGRMLMTTGRAHVLFDEPDPAGETGGTGRFWELAVDRWIDLPLPPEVSWEFLDASPFNPTGPP